MRNQFATYLALSFVFLSGEVAAQGAILGSFVLGGGAGIIYPNPPDPNNVSFHVAVGPSALNCFNRNNCAEMFLFEPFQASSVGQEFLINDLNYVNFAAVRSVLTNGIDDGITFGMRFGTTLPVNIGGGFGINESYFGLSSGVDFKGLNVGAVGLTINSFTIRPFTFISPDALGAEITFTINVYDDAGPVAVPEPSSFILAGVGLGLGAFAAKRRKA